MHSGLIEKAIAERRCLSFFYSFKQRVVEPHLLGFDNSGDLTLSAWQLSGGSGQGWRDFHVSKISGLAIDPRTFAGPRHGYNPQDRTLWRIVCHL